MPDAVTDLEVGCYVYAVLPADQVVAGLHGLDDAEVEYVVHEGLAAAVSRIPLDRPPGRRAELTAHQGVVEALAKEGAVVPVRFGSVLDPEDEAVRELLEQEGDRFAAVLERLAGHVQLNLRATYVEDQVLAEVVASDPEIAELRRRTRDLPDGTMHPDLVRLGEAVSRAMEIRRTDDGTALLDQVVPLVADRSVRPGGGVDHLLDVALLVESDRVEELEEVLETLAEAWHERIRMRLVGPVAPYDFAEVDAWG
jgi:hypothetical protein